MNTRAIIAIVGLGAAVFAATSSGEKIRWMIWDKTRGELNSLPFFKRCKVAWNILWGDL